MRTFIIVFLVALFCVSSAFSQRRYEPIPKIKDKPYYSVVQIGLSNPGGPDRLKDFWSFGLTASYGIDKKITPFYALNTTVMCNAFIFKKEDFLKLKGITDYIAKGPFEILATAMVNGKYTPEPENDLMVYFFGGCGLMYRNEGKIQYTISPNPYSTYSNGKVETVFCVNAGLGTEYYIPQIKSELVIELKWVVGGTSGGIMYFFPFTAGLRF